MSNSSKVQLLSQFSQPPDYRATDPFLRSLAWYFIGLPLLRCDLPGSSWRRRLLLLFGAALGVGLVIKPRLTIKYPWRLVVGNHCWLGESIWIDNLEWVVIGSNVCISQGAYLCTGNHDYRNPNFSYLLGKIVIHSQSWICAMSCVSPGITVGEGAVLGIGSVATTSLEPFSIYSGNPARKIRSRIATDD